MPHRDALKAAARQSGALVEGLRMRNEIDGWGMSHHDLARAWLDAQVTILTDTFGEHEASALLEEQLHKIRVSSLEEETEQA